jgi:hypothetical protein
VIFLPRKLRERTHHQLHDVALTSSLSPAVSSQALNNLADHLQPIYHLSQSFQPERFIPNVDDRKRDV